MPDVHATATVHPDAELGEGVQVEPYAVIHAHACIGDRCQIGSGSVVHSGVSMGAGNVLSEHVVLGGPPQDLTADPKCESGVVIGDNNRFREFFTAHRSAQEGECTRIGSDCFFMFSSHVAHDCVVEDHVVLAGYTALAGHVEVGLRAFLSGHVLVHQHVRVGRLAMIAGLTPVDRDVLPYALLGRSPAVHYGLNRVGLKRAGISGARYDALADAWKELRRGADAQQLPEASEEVAYLKAWLAAPTRRGHAPLSNPARKRGAE